MFDGSKFTFEKAELEQKEKLGNPDVTKTENIKSANYGKLVDGVVERGSRIVEDDVLIGKYLTVPKGTGRDAKSVYVDRSIVYRDTEEAIVQNVIVDRNEDAMRFAKVGLRKVRPLVVGDKLCLLPTAEVLTENGWQLLKDIDIATTKVATMDPESFELSYVNPINKYEFDYNSKKDGKMYYLKTQQIHTICTPKHKNFVKRMRHNSFELMEAADCYARRLKFKKNCENKFPEATTVVLKDSAGVQHRYPMDPYLKLLGMFLSDGYTNDKNGIVLTMRKQRKRDYITALERALGFTFVYTADDRIRCGKLAAIGIFEEFKRLSVGCLNKFIPKYVWKLGPNNCKALLDGLMNGDGCVNNKGSWSYASSSIKLCNDVQRLAFHCGYTANIRFHEKAGTVKTIRGRSVVSTVDSYTVNIIFTINEPIINYGKNRINNEEKWIDYNGKVHCIEVPDTHLFYYRENMLSPPVWTGNSSRAGQKGIAAMLLREADMPFTKSGIRPDILFNPHGMPSRMTCSQLLESLIGNICAINGSHYDGTIFKDNDIESYAEMLEQYGMNRYGYERMINGITGEFIDTLIFFGPTYYQRLQKFVSDAEYSVRHALTDALTAQPLDLLNKSKCYLITVVLVYIW